MQEKYLVVNAGSSSLKFSLYDMPDKTEIVNGLVEKIGNKDSSYTIKFNGQKIKESKFISNHLQAINTMFNTLLTNRFINSLEQIKGVGHRILHGGQYYSDSVLIDEEVIKNIKSLTCLGPIHHPSEISVIKSIKELLPNVEMVAVFDTAFHQTMPDYNYIYPVPYEWYEKYGVRKYGFHGTSHKYITSVMQEKLGKKNVNLIICHVGSGVSVSCIKEGVCHNTSMGLTPLAGTMMGTRSGSIDSSIVSYIQNKTNLDLSQIMDILNTKSGLLGLCGENDLRDVQKGIENNCEKSKLAFEIYTNSIVEYIAKYYFELNAKIDGLVLTAGAGENSSFLRKILLDKISIPMNIKMDEEMNESIASFKDKKSGTITTKDSSFPVMVIPTNEELMILTDTYKLINNKNKVKVK